MIKPYVGLYVPTGGTLLTGYGNGITKELSERSW